MELALVGGTVIDPANGRSGQLDIVFSKGRVAQVTEKLNLDHVREEVDVSGKIVVPGLIDFHTHVYHGGTSLGIHADNHALDAGVTTFVDAGSAGPGNFLGFHDHVIKNSRSRIFAFLNISFAGIYGFNLGVGECENLKLCDAAETLAKAREYVDHIVGIKVRVGMSCSAGNGVLPLEIAKQVSDKLAKPLMAHIDKPPPTIAAVLRRLGRGDILTHCFRPYPNQPIDRSGLVHQYVIDARQRGVIFDTGHGRGSFGFETASKMLENGFDPDVISSDIHSDSINGPAHSLLHVMSKFLALGMSFEKVIEKTTIAPARAMDQTDLGHLGVGACGDATILHIEEGTYDFFDVNGERIVADRHLVCDGLVVNGLYWPSV
jgi:dihydroorotase